MKNQSFNIFKSINWVMKEEGILHARFDLLRWQYYICPNENGTFELLLLDDADNYSQEIFSCCTTIIAAKKKAYEHYCSTLSQFIRPGWN